jgi:hypothetical protein
MGDAAPAQAARQRQLRPGQARFAAPPADLRCLRCPPSSPSSPPPCRDALAKLDLAAPLPLGLPPAAPKG